MSTVVHLTDNEVAVLIDALAAARNLVEPACTPNVNSALAKINSLMAPDVAGLIVSTNRFAPFEDRELLVMHVNCDADAENWSRLDDVGISRGLATEAEAEISRRPSSEDLPRINEDA